MESSKTTDKTRSDIAGEVLWTRKITFQAAVVLISFFPSCAARFERTAVGDRVTIPINPIGWENATRKTLSHGYDFKQAGRIRGAARWRRGPVIRLFRKPSVIDDTARAKLELKGGSGVLFSDDHRKWQDDGYHVPNREKYCAI